MRYVDLETFLTMPDGTVYMEDRDVRDDGIPTLDCNRVLKIKGETTPYWNDWVVFDLIELKGSQNSSDYADMMLDMMEAGHSVEVDPEPVGCRKGEYPKQGEIFFYVLDEADTRAVIGLLKTALEWRGAKS